MIDNVVRHQRELSGPVQISAIMEKMPSFDSRSYVLFHKWFMQLFTTYCFAWETQLPLNGNYKQ